MSRRTAPSELRDGFAPASSFFPPTTKYSLAPFRFTRIPDIESEVLLVNELGEFHFLPEPSFRRFLSHELSASEETYLDLRAKHFLLDEYAESYWPYAVSQYRTRKSFLDDGPALHIVVVTLRCDHSCHYCQVSRQQERAGSRFDLSDEHARLAIDRIFESPAIALKIEFQGGEPLLAFGMISRIVEEVERRALAEARQVEFVIATALSLLTAEQLSFCRDHRITLSTSLDGPAALHNRNRPRRARDAHARAVSGIRAAREVLGPGSVSALLTVSRETLQAPEEVVDAYAQLGLREISLRPISPYGFAARNAIKLGYSVAEFLEFHDRALAHIIRLNRAGTYLEESYTALLLRHIVTPYPTGYVDLRSPAGAMLGALVYNYNGDVYASDEGRMLAEDGDHTFRLGTVRDSYHALLTGPSAARLIQASVAEALPGCSDCAFLPYCGADPVFHRAAHSRFEGHRPTSDFCRRQTALFQRLFQRLRRSDSAELEVLMSWVRATAVGTDATEARPSQCYGPT